MHYAPAMLMSRGLASLLVVGLGLASLGASCGQAGLALMPGVINNPANRSLRQALFRFATSEMCTELTTRTVPLALHEGDPAIGRFFPNSCGVQELANENLLVQLAGHGYAWSNISRRLGFVANAGVEYEHDFLMNGSTMYVYFRQRSTSAAELRTQMIEAPNAGPLGPLFGNLQRTVQELGNRLLAAELTRGFTVIRDSSGDTSFSLGLLEVGARPFVPFDKGESDWPLLANERTEVHAGQRDFTGPYRIGGPGQALYVTVTVEGAPTVDLVAVRKDMGDAWIAAYERDPVAGPPPGPPAFEEAVVAPPPGGNPPPVHRRMLRLPPGWYYIVMDNTATAGPSAPPAIAGDDRAALVSYAVQLGDAP